MNHLKTIHVPVDRFVLGFNPSFSKFMTMHLYEESWRLVDERALIEDLPIYHAYSRYYGLQPLKRRTFEAKILGTNSTEGQDLAHLWVDTHVKLYHDIKKNGFDPSKRRHPITVNIRDNGDLPLVDGNHTITILKHLNYKKKIEAYVAERKDGWLKLKDRLYNLYGRKLLYQPVGHPDFDDWQIDRPCLDRWRIIESNVDFKEKRVLDVGSCTGFFSQHAAAAGARVVGVEPNPTRAEASRIFSRFHGFPESNPLFVEERFEKYLSSYKNPKFDAALMLSLLHHYIRRDPREAWEAVDLLSRCCRAMVLEVETGNLPIEWRPELILSNSGYTKYRVLSEENRPLYVFTV